MWTPTQELKDCHRQLRENASTESAVQKTMNAEIVKKVKKRLRDTGQENYIVGKLPRDCGLLSGGKKVKRVASYQLEAERERVRRMKGEWSNIINLTQGVRKMFDIYFQNYGELAAPPEIVYDPSLDE